MNLPEIRFLQQFRDYPSVSIMLPVYRTPEEARRNRERLESMINQVEGRLGSQIHECDVKPIMRKLRTVVSNIDFRQHFGTSLVILVNRHFAKKVHLHADIAERLVIAESFCLRELIDCASDNLFYRVLALSQTKIRLLNGTKGSLSEANVDCFPLTQSHPSIDLVDTSSIADSATLRGTQAGYVRQELYSSAVWKLIDNQQRLFFKQADSNLKGLLQQMPSPVILVGKSEDIALYRSVSSVQPEQIAGILECSLGHGELWIKQLHVLCLEFMQSHQRRTISTALRELNQAAQNNQCAAGIKAVWQTAEEGRCKKILVERGYICPATVKEDGLHLQQALPADQFGPSVIPDAVDALIGKVLCGSGSVCFVDDGLLGDFGHVAAVLHP